MRHKFSKQGANVICYITIISIIVGFFVNNTYTTAYGYDERAAIVVGISTTLNVRSDAGTGNSVVGTLKNSDEVTVVGEKYATDGSLWYQVKYIDSESKTIIGYCHSNYIEIVYKSDVDFETYLSEQGFPESYKPALRTLHEKYPNWVFKADVYNYTWAEVLQAENVIGRSLIASDEKSSWKSTVGSAYNWKTGKWTGYDGPGWVQASNDLVAYYLDPRNFLDETSIFQFESLSYNPAFHNEDGVKKLIKSTFMATATIENNKTYSSAIMEAAVRSNVSPYHLSSSIIQEIGSTTPSTIISGTVPGYLGIYNYYNWGAYTTSNATAIQNGLIYAAKSDPATLRPWKTRLDAIVGGAIKLGNDYINRGQNTPYYKKFDLVTPYSHQYMTHIRAAELEGTRSGNAYTQEMKNTMNFVFNIPVYKSMPDTVAALPTKDGSPNNALKSLSVSGCNLTPTFNYNTLNYAIEVANSVSKVKISATAYDSTATISGTGELKLAVGSNKATIKVTAQNGDVRNYVITIVRKEGTQVTTTFTTSFVKDTTKMQIRGLASKTKVEDFLKACKVENGSISVVNSSGTAKTTGYIATSDKVIIKDSAGKKISEYTCILYGDVNGDGVINIIDSYIIRKYNLGTYTLTGAFLEAGDVNRGGDGINIMDAYMLRKYNLGQRTLNQN